MTAFRDWLNMVFGAEGGRAVQVIIALLLVVALLLALAWLFRRVFGAGLSGGKGGRLAVVDAAHVDNRRRLVLLRRDDVEHLVMIGGPNDLLVESRILRAPPVLAGQPGRVAPRTAPRPPEEEPARIADEPPARAVTSQPRAGVAAIGAALAGAGAFVRARTHRGEEAAPAAAEPTAPAERRTVDMAFDAPLGRDEAETRARPIPAPAPRETEAPRPPRFEAEAPQPLRVDEEAPRPAAPPQSPFPPFAPRAEAPRSEPTPRPIEPPPFPARREPPAEPAFAEKPAPRAHAAAPTWPAPFPAAPVAPVPEPAPVVAPTPRPAPAAEPAPVVAPAGDAQERIGLELERALAGLGLAEEPAPHRPAPAPVVVPAPEEIRSAAQPSAHVDLLSELEHVVSEKLHHEAPIEAPAAKIEPRFEPAVDPAPAEPVAAPRVEAEPVAVPPVDLGRFQRSFDAPPASEPAIENAAPEVTIPAAPSETTAAPEVTPEPPPAKSPVDELEEEMARLLSEISGPMRR